MLIAFAGLVFQVVADAHPFGARLVPPGVLRDQRGHARHDGRRGVGVSAAGRGSRRRTLSRAWRRARSRCAVAMPASLGCSSRSSPRSTPTLTTVCRRGRCCWRAMAVPVRLRRHRRQPGADAQPVSRRARSTAWTCSARRSAASRSSSCSNVLDGPSDDRPCGLGLRPGGAGASRALGVAADAQRLRGRACSAAGGRSPIARLSWPSPTRVHAAGCDPLMVKDALERPPAAAYRADGTPIRASSRHPPADRTAGAVGAVAAPSDRAGAVEQRFSTSTAPPARRCPASTARRRRSTSCAYDIVNLAYHLPGIAQRR